MVNVAAFERDLLGEVEDKLHKPLLETVQLVARTIYKSVFANWPTDTFWSLANNQIAINRRADFTLIPGVRPTQTGALAVQSQASFRRNLQVLNTVTTKMVKRADFKILIGNTVPYAADVGFIPGKGSMIYAEAARQGANVRGRR